MPQGPLKTNEIPDMGITLPDGTRLSARVWMPDDARDNPVPAILEFLPYRKRDGTAARDATTHPHFARHGYACLRVDMRGNGDSQGVMDDEYSPRELADAVEVVNWIAAQNWCSGNVGMMGISWGGFNALQVAALAPKPLKAIVTVCSTVDRFADDIHYKGGCLLNANFGWGATMLCYSSRAPDPALVGDKWREMWLERLNDEPFLTTLWASHQHRDAYWKHGSVCEDYSAIKAATLTIGGWRDGYKNAPQSLLENLGAPAKGIIGPWIHKYPHIAAPEPRIDFIGETLRWWDHWLKGLDTGVKSDPDLRLFMLEQGATSTDAANGCWINQDFRNAPQKVLHLGAKGLGEIATPFTVNIDCPASTGLSGEEIFTVWPGGAFTAGQSADDAQSICFDTDQLDADLSIVGAVRMDLTLTSTTPVAQIAARLCEVDAQGKSHLITTGVLNLTHRESAQNPAPLPVNTPFTASLNLDQIAYRLPAGSRLRLSLSNAYWPLIWPAPGHTKLGLSAGKISLPLLHENTDNPVEFTAPETPPTMNVRTIRDASQSRDITTNPETGLLSVACVDDAGEVEDLEHGLINGTVAREWWDIHPYDPLSARARAHWSYRNARGDWSVRTETFSEMWSDAQAFHFTARIEAYEGEKLIFERDFSKTIPRDLV